MKWHVESGDSRTAARVRRNHDGVIVVSLPAPSRVPARLAQQLATAHLIAAAPDLLEAVEAVLGGIAEKNAGKPQSRDVVAILVAALAKAKGGAK